MDQAAPTEAHQTTLLETVARHFPNAAIAGDTVSLGFAQLRLRCRVESIHVLHPSLTSVSLFFELLGSGEPIFMSCSGYETEPTAAIVVGACNWCCTFGPVFRQGFTGAAPDTAEKPNVFEATLDGQEFEVTVDGLYRSMGTAGGAPDLQAVGKHLGGTPFLLPGLLASGLLPLLPSGTPTVLSLFVMESSARRVVEVKVNGVDWVPASTYLGAVPPTTEPGQALLRELAVLQPRSPEAPLSRQAIERTLHGLRLPLHGGTRIVAAWAGWAAHQGLLEPPLHPTAIAELEEAIGPLPADYRQFLVEVAEAGAGPGYGLLSPRGFRQAALARGRFPLVAGAPTEGPLGGVLALADGGCACVWLLVLEGAHRGEVWVYPMGSDARARSVAPSFSAWYRAWLDSGVRDRSAFVPWDGDCCAPAAVLRQAYDRREPKYRDLDPVAYFRIAKLSSLSITAPESPLFDGQERVDPCQSCTMLVERLGIGATVFAPGVRLFGSPAPRPKEPDAPAAAEPPASLPWWKRWLSRD